MPQDRLALRIDRDDIGFSAAHFTIFSRTERERLHGHNFTVGVEVIATQQENHMIFDYRILKSRLRELCAVLDERLLLPTRSDFLQITKVAQNVECRFGSEHFSFPVDDVVMLDLQNITLEAMAEWFLAQVLETPALPIEQLAELTISVASSRGQQVSRQAILA